MAIRIDDSIVYGELRNVAPWSTHGVIVLEGAGRPVLVELTGNCAPDLQGKTFRFAPRSRESMEAAVALLSRNDAPEAAGDPDALDADPKVPAPLPDKFAFHQIGVTGGMTASRWVRSLPCSVREYMTRARLGEKPPTRWVRSLYLEWYSQNGRCVIELEDPILEYETAADQWAPLPPSTPQPETDPDAPPTGPDGEPLAPEITIVHQDGRVRRINADDLREAQERGEDATDDLQRHLDAETRDLERTLRGGGGAGGFGEVGGSGDALAAAEFIDDLMDHAETVSPASLFDENATFPRPDEVSEAQAAALLSTLLMELAFFGIALHACPHSTARQLYRILVEHVLFENGVFRELKNTGWTTNYLAAEYCPLCEAETEARFGHGK